VSDFDLLDVVGRLERIEAKLDLLTKAKASESATKSEGDIAPGSDLDGKYGNEEIRRDPPSKYWSGESYAGRRMSECPADYLDAYAKYKNACAFMNEKEGKEDKAKYVGYDRKSAARARGWAQRIRSGYKAPAKPQEASDDSIPF
jgi:hypothetical protein